MMQAKVESDFLDLKLHINIEFNRFLRERNK